MSEGPGSSYGGEQQLEEPFASTHPAPRKKMSAASSAPQLQRVSEVGPLPSTPPSMQGSERGEERRSTDKVSRLSSPPLTLSHTRCPMPNAQCPPMPNAQCPVPSAQRPIPNAQYPMPLWPALIPIRAPAVAVALTLALALEARPHTPSSSASPAPSASASRALSLERPRPSSRLRRSSRSTGTQAAQAPCPLAAVCR